MAKFSHIVDEDAIIAEAFNQPPFETEMFKKGAGDVYFTFESGGDTFRIQFYTSGGLGKNVRRVYIGTKQGAGFKDVIKKFDNPAKIIATMIDATEKYLQTPLGKSVDGLAFDLSKKASPKGVKPVKMVLKRSKVFKRYMEMVDLDAEIEVDKGRSIIWAVRKGKNPADIFNGKKVEGLMPSAGGAVEPIVEPEPEVEPETNGDHIIDAFDLEMNDGRYDGDIGDEDWLEVDGSKWAIFKFSSDEPYASGSVGDSDVINKIKKAVRDYNGTPDVVEPEPPKPTPEVIGITAMHEHITTNVPRDFMSVGELSDNQFTVTIDGVVYEIKPYQNYETSKTEIGLYMDGAPIFHDRFWGPVLEKLDTFKPESRVDPRTKHIYDWEIADKAWVQFLDDNNIPYKREFKEARPEIMDGGGSWYSVDDKVFVEIKHNGYEKVEATFGHNFGSNADPEKIAKWVISQYKHTYGVETKIIPSDELFFPDRTVDLDDEETLFNLLLDTLVHVVADTEHFSLTQDQMENIAADITQKEAGKLMKPNNHPYWTQIIASSLGGGAGDAGGYRTSPDNNAFRQYLDDNYNSSSFSHDAFKDYMNGMYDNASATDFHVRDVTERLLKYSSKAKLNSRESNMINRELPRILKLAGGKHTLLSFAKTDSRAYHIGGSNSHINVGSFLDVTTLWHEMGHDIEDTYPKVHKECVEFLLKRIKKVKDQAKPVNDMGRMRKGASGEWALDDPFGDSYAGRLYYPKSVMNDDPHDIDADYHEERISKLQSTEVLSMGLQYFYSARSAETLYKKDPELFEFTRQIIEEISK